jgi:hypothetical protein
MSLRQVLAYFCDAHGDGRDPADNVSVGWITNMPGPCSRMGSGNENQLVAVQLAPTAHVATPELNEIDGTIEVVLPIPYDLSLSGVYFHEGARADQRVQGVILYPDIPIHRISPIHLLQQVNWNVGPAFKHLRHEIGFF